MIMGDPMTMLLAILSKVDVLQIAPMLWWGKPLETEPKC